MTVINHKNISGITSITTPAGSDNLFTVHTNDTTERFRIDASGHQNISGIITASNFKTGTTNVHNVGVEAAGINVLGADTPIGTGATIYDAGGAVFTGVVTATSFSGGLPITNGADNRIITASSASAIQGESTLTYDGSWVDNVISGTGGYKITTSGDHAPQIIGNANRSAVRNTLLSLHGYWNNTHVAMIDFQAGPDNTNKDDGRLSFYTRYSGESMKERMRINSDGKISLGSNANFTPGARLEIRDTIGGGGGTGLVLNDIGSSGALEGLHIEWRSGSDKQADQVRIGQAANATGSGSNFFVATNHQDSGSSTEKLRITSTGEVNIGGNYSQTAAPLCVTTDANTYGMRLMSGSNIVCDIMNNDSAGNSEIRGYYNNNSGSRGEGYRIEANGDTYFNPGGTTGVIIKSTGRFGVGTNSPDHIFEVESNNSSIAVSRSGSNAQLLFKSNSVGQAGQIQVDESSGGGYMDFYTKTTGGTLTKRLSMDTSGRLLTYGTLGVANIPLGGNAANAALHIRCNNKYKGIAFGENAVSGTIGMGGDDTSTALVYTANANPANLGGGEHATHEWWSGNSGGGGPAKFMVLTTAGNLGIGTAGPDAKLDVGGSAPEIRMTNTATSRSYFSWYNHYGGLKRNADISYNEGNANWEFKLYRADAQANSPYGNIQFFTGSTSSPTLAMNITRPGSVTMPKQPCCVMYANAATTWSSGWTKIPLSSTRYDVGNNFDSGNNRYAIPITGKYAIGYNVEINIGSGQTWIYLVPRINRNDTTSKNAGINYADFAPVSNNSSNHYYCHQGHWIASLSQGDTVTWETHGAGNAWTIANANQSHYYIYQVA